MNAPTNSSQKNRVVWQSHRNAYLFFIVAALFAGFTRESQAQINAPTNLAANATVPETVTLTWQDNSSNEGNFELQYRFVGNPTFAILTYTALNVTSFTFTAPPGLEYRVRATSGAGPDVFSTFSSTVTANPPIKPPTALSASNSTPERIVLTWTNNSSVAGNNEIQYRFVGDTNFTTLNYVSGTTTTFTALGIPPSPIEWRVRATVGSGPNYFSTPAGPLTANATMLTPSGLSASVLANGQVRLIWTDNSGVEGNYEIQRQVQGEPGFTTHAYTLENVTTYDVVGVPPTVPVTFRVRATFGQGPDYFSGFSGNVTATPLMPAPTTLTATVLGEQSVKFDWIDNSGTEQGFIVQARFHVNGSPSGSFFDIGSTAVNAQTLTVNAPNLPYPGIAYEFRVVAAYDPDGAGSAPPILSNPSNAVSRTLAFNAPSALSATVVNESSVNLAWTDNSSVETKYTVLARRVGATSWGVLADKPAGATSHSATSLLPGTAFEFAVIGVYTRATSDEVETPLSNIASATTPLNAPTGLQLQSGSLTDTQAVLTWTDASSVEGGFEILSRPGGSSSAPTTFALLAANGTSATIPLTPGTSREFFVRSFYVRSNTEGDVALSSNSNGVTVNAKDAMTSAIYVEVVKDVLMTPYTLTHTSQSALQSRNITGLPTGLSFNSSSGQVTGTPTGSGVIQSTVTLSFADGWTQTKILAFRILRAPVVATFPNQSISLGSPSVVSLTGKFTDPDASSAARVNTNLTTNGGNMDFILFDAATPLHVANFMGYANRGDYVNTVFHRSIAGFISQGGAFRAGSGATTFTAVPTVASPTNEPGISNVRGTVALAKLGGQPSSGTNQFFVNLANNGPNSLANLDAQNGGFTAFARVTAPGMAVADALAALPTGDYNVTVDSTANTFEDFPVNAASAPATMNNALAVKINSVTALPVLSYSLVSNSLPSIATASVNGTSLTLTPVAAGTTTVVVRATDLEGLNVDHSITVTVNGTFASWATSESLPNGQNGALDDADTDGTTNLEEWAFLSSPSSGSELGKPTPSVSPTGDPTGRIHFKARKFAAGLSFIVQASETLNSGDWVDIWNSEIDGYASPRVTVNEDNADHRVLTVTDVETIVTGAERRFLRVKLVQAP